MIPGNVRASEIGFSDSRGRCVTSRDRKVPPRAGLDWINGAPASAIMLWATEPSSIEKFMATTS